MNNILQKVGTGLLIASLVLLFLKSFLWCYIVLGAVLAVDIWLVYKKLPTITRWYRQWLPKKVDIALTVGIIALFIWLHGSIVGLYLLQGTISGHLNGDW